MNQLQDVMWIFPNIKFRLKMRQIDDLNGPQGQYCLQQATLIIKQPRTVAELIKVGEMEQSGVGKTLDW